MDQPGRYAVSFVNDGEILHNITFADGTVVEAEGGQTAEGEVVVPAEGLGYVCSIPGHADGGMEGAITVAGGHAEVPHAGASQAPGAEPDHRARPECARVHPARRRPRRRWPKAACTTSSSWSASTR